MKRINTWAIISSIIIILGVPALCWFYRPPLVLKHMHFPDPDEWPLVKDGDTLILNETDTSVEVGFFHSFRGYKPGERLVVYKED